MNNDSVDEIMYFLKHTNPLSEDNIEDAVRALGDIKDKRVIPFLLNMLINEKHENFVRDSLAITLGKLGANEAVPFFIRLIQCPENVNNRGSLIYALWNLDCKDYFLDFIEIVCTGDFESRQMALELVEKYSHEVDVDIKKKAFEILKSHRVILEISNKQEKTENTIDVIEYVEELLLKHF